MIRKVLFRMFALSFQSSHLSACLEMFYVNYRLIHSCSCDIPAHGYTFSWEGNPRWSKAYVGSVELFEYFKGRATAYGIHEHLRLQHRVVRARWDGGSGTWKLEIEDIVAKKTFLDEAEVVINACGFLK
jgi:cation diffusion facilitator CzcD-associated flavoprotein CzcO